VDLYLHSPIRLHAMALNQSETYVFMLCFLVRRINNFTFTFNYPSIGRLKNIFIMYISLKCVYNFDITCIYRSWNGCTEFACCVMDAS
jgi:hypothetical protein